MTNAETAGYGRIVFAMCLSASLVPLMGSALNLALPQINNEFSLNAVQSGWIMTSYMLATAIFQIPCAKLADMFGRRTVFTAGLSLFLVFSLLCTFAWSGTSLIAFRALSGIASAMIFSTNVAILTSSVPPQKRGWVLGINTATVYFSLAAGPVIGGIFTQTIGWRSIFVLATVISIIVLITTLVVFRGTQEDKAPQKFDLPGMAIYACGLFLLIYGFSKLPSLAGFVMLAAGIATLALFTWYEKRTSHPLLDIGIFFRNKVFRHGCLSALINYSATTSISFMLSLYLQNVRQLSPSQAAGILIGQSVVMALVSLRAGRLSDRISPTRMATAGMLIISIGLICLCFITATTPFAYIIAVLLVVGFGFGIFSSPNMNIIMGSVTHAEYSLASATTGTMRLVGQTFSMGLAMMCLSLFMGDAQLSLSLNDEMLRAIRLTFIISSALCLIGAYSSSIRTRKL